MRQSMEHQNMEVEDKLSRLNEMYYRSKGERDKRKKNKRVQRNSNFVLNKKDIEDDSNQNFADFVYEGQEKYVQEIEPKKIRVQSAVKNKIKKQT